METFNDPALEELVRICARFVRRFKAWCSVKPGKSAEFPSWLSILGKTGTGKTHCARKVWKHVSGKFNWSPMEFIEMPVYWPAFIRDLRLGDRFEQSVEMASKWPVVFLDDIGAERDTTGFASEQLNTMLGSRVGKWTILTSNLTLEQLGEIDPRISDRIIREPGNAFLEVDTSSYAVRLAHNRK